MTSTDNHRDNIPTPEPRQQRVPQLQNLWARNRIRSAIAVGLAFACSACSPGPNSSATTTLAKAAPPDITQDSAASPAAATPQVRSPIRIGVLAIDSAVSARRRYYPLAEYLSKTTGQPFILVPLTQESQFEAAAAADMHFVFTNPLAAVQLQRLYQTEFIATQVRLNTADQFGGQIIVKRDSPIQTLADLQGKAVACVDFQTAAGGCVFQIHHLQQRGIDPHTDFSRFIEIPSQDNIILAVLNGTIEAGFIRTGQIEATTKKGLLPDPSAIRILEPQNDFFYLHTTALYPEWPISALPQADPALVAAVETALLSLPVGHPALATANLRGFTTAQDYGTLTELIEQLQLKSWDAD